MSKFRAASHAAPLWLSALFFMAFFGGVLLTSAATAQDITLTSRDGSVVLSGDLLGFDGEFYRIDSAYGELTVDSTGVLCEGPACPNLEDYVARLSISGASSMAQVLLPALIEGFALREGYGARREDLDASHFEYVLIDTETGRDIGRFLIRSTNSDEGFADLLANEADIAMSLREVHPEEANRARDAGLGDLRARGRFRVLALDALVPVVSQTFPLAHLSLQELADIFSGDITNWSRLGGPDANVSLYLRNAESGLAQVAQSRVLRPKNRTLTDAIQWQESDLGLALAVAADPFGIGLASAAETGRTRQLGLMGACGRLLRATRQTVKTEDYPLTAPMFLYLPARRLPRLAREFLFYTQSAPAQLVVRRAGFIDRAPEKISAGQQGDRLINAIGNAGAEIPLAELQRLASTMGSSTRLSTTFRFEPGSTRLDAQSLANIDQLARRLEDGAYDGQHLVFVGFSDGQGPAAGNKNIAERRADAVRQAVVDAAETADFNRVQISMDSFGEALPMACDDTEWGRQINRRVEVWLR